jgi:hypothetical protein
MLGSKRALLVVVLPVMALWLGSTGALAAGNLGRVPFPAGPPANVTCSGVPAVAVVSFDNEFAKTYTLADGTVKVMVEGRQIVTVTGNGKVLVFNSSGPGAIYFRPDHSVTVVVQGHTFYITPALDGMGLYTGLLTVDGTTGLIISHDGHVTDICALVLS